MGRESRPELSRIRPLSTQLEITNEATCGLERAGRQCTNHCFRDSCIEFTRCRPYRKNDQAWVEQKNGAVVRRMIGYRRFEGLEAAAALARLYALMRLFVNFFQPSFKLAAKARDGAQVRSAITRRPPRVNGCWRTHGRPSRCDTA